MRSLTHSPSVPSFIPPLAACLVLLAWSLPTPLHAQTPATTIDNSTGDVRLQLNHDGGLYVPGTFGPTAPADSIPAAGEGTRMMWYPAKAAFRVGRIINSSAGPWDPDNVGNYSVATGRNTIASGGSSVALGDATEATGEHAVALGTETRAYGLHSTALGDFARAYGDISTALGFSTLADGQAATALGQGTEALADHTTAMGFSTAATTQYATAMGRNTSAEARSATALGEGTTASGVASTALGQGTVAATFNSVTLGSWNEANRSFDSSLLVAGNGTDPSDGGSRSNALVLTQSGDLEIAGTLTESSDRRLKTDIKPMESVLSALKDIRPVRFHFKEGTGHPSDRQIGLIAQEVQSAFPALVQNGSEGYLSLAYPKFSAVLLKGLQEQQTQIESQKAQIDSLRKQTKRLDALQKRVARLEKQSGDGSMLAGLPGPHGLLIVLVGGAVVAGLVWRRQSRAS